MATNASKYYAAYMQSHTDRFQKFRDEAYAELVEKQGRDDAYRKLLQQREKALMDAAARLRRAASTGTKLTASDLGLLIRANDQIIEAGEDAAKRGLQIEKDLRNSLVAPKASNDQIAEMDASLATGGAVTADPAVIAQLVSGGIEGVASTVAPGSSQAAAAAQNTWKSLSANPSFLMLSPAQREAAKAKVSTSFGLDTVNIGGMSGAALIDAPQDKLVEVEMDRLQAEFGGAFGTAKARANQKKIDEYIAAKEAGNEPAAIAAIDSLAAGIEADLPGIRKKLAEAPKPEFTETDVRALARQKYGPEAATMLRQQFERDSIGGDPEKLEYIRIRIWWAGNDPRRSDQSDRDSRLERELERFEKDHLQELLPIFG
jgi:hypothetical protein